MTRDELTQMRAWAEAKIATGAEPPWTWYQYMKLREALDALLGGMEVATPQTARSLRPEQRSGTGLRLAVTNGSPDAAQPHRQVVPTQLPT